LSEYTIRTPSSPFRAPFSPLQQPTSSLQLTSHHQTCPSFDLLLEAASSQVEQTTDSEYPLSQF